MISLTNVMWIIRRWENSIISLRLRFLEIPHKENWVSWGVLFKGLGVQKGTQTPCWLRPWSQVSSLSYNQVQVKGYISLTRLEESFIIIRFFLQDDANFLGLWLKDNIVNFCFILFCSQTPGFNLSFKKFILFIIRILNPTVYINVPWRVYRNTVGVKCEFFALL